MSFKGLFSRSLGPDPDRLHLAAHSHHLWPDASFEGQAQCWEDAARFADRKWDKVMGEVWPQAQRHVADELGTGMPDAVVFASNPHDFLIRLTAAAPRADPRRRRVLMSDGEFHSARRQFARWAETAGSSLRPCRRALRRFHRPFSNRGPKRRGGPHLVTRFVRPRRRVDGVAELAGLSRPAAPGRDRWLSRLHGAGDSV